MRRSWEMRIVYFTALAIFALLFVGCASGGANNTGGEIVGGILQGVGAGLSGL